MQQKQTFYKHYAYLCITNNNKKQQKPGLYTKIMYAEKQRD
jgi:hypothetical protein